MNTKPYKKSFIPPELRPTVRGQHLIVSGKQNPDAAGIMKDIRIEDINITKQRRALIVQLLTSQSGYFGDAYGEYKALLESMFPTLVKKAHNI